jgi:hypothetical protein
MDAATPRQDALLARLRDEIRRIERRPARRPGLQPCGIEAVDAALPGGGFPRGVLSELRGGPASGKTAVALALVAALGEEELAAVVDGAGELYPPAAAALGVDLERLLLVRPAHRPRPGVDLFWAAEALLGSGAFGAVIVDVPIPGGLRGADGLLRRLQSAAERGGAIGLWLAPSAGSIRVPAGPRLEIALRAGRIVASAAGRGGGAAGRAEGAAGRGAMARSAGGGDAA